MLQSALGMSLFTMARCSWWGNVTPKKRGKIEVKTKLNRKTVGTNINIREVMDEIVEAGERKRDNIEMYYNNILYCNNRAYQIATALSKVTCLNSSTLEYVLSWDKL